MAIDDWLAGKKTERVGWEVGTIVRDCNTPVDLPPIPDRYKLDALDLVCIVRECGSLDVRRAVDSAARWLMERDKRWNTK